MPARFEMLPVDRARGLVVDADDGAVAGPLAREDVLLGRDVARQVAVAIDVVGRDVEPDRDIGAEGLAAARAGRTTAPARRCRPHRAARGRARRGRYCRRPRSARPAACRIWPISAVVVDLPLVPVMPTKPRLRLRARQKLDVAHDRLAGGARRRRHRMRLGQPARYAGADDERRRRATSRWKRGSARRAPACRGGLARRLRCRPRRRSRSRPPVRARTVARPERASPSTTNDEPFRMPRSIIRLTSASRWRGRPSPGWRR